MKFSRLELVLLLVYAVVVAIGIEAINAAWGQLLPQHSAPQDGSGYGKMRGPMGEFQAVLFLLGTWVYPACAFAFLGFIQQGRAAKTKSAKWLNMACAFLCVALFARVCYLGVFTAGWGQFL